MLIETRALGFELTDAIRQRVESHVQSIVGRFARSIVRVTVRVEDINADRGGIDKKCSMAAAVKRHGVVFVDSTQPDLYTAIDLAAARLQRAVLRATTRSVARERRNPSAIRTTFAQ